MRTYESLVDSQAESSFYNVETKNTIYLCIFVTIFLF